MASTGTNSLWFCHQCRAEVHSLMTPHPICASCRGSFIEKIADPAEVPSTSRSSGTNTSNLPRDLRGVVDGVLRAWRTEQGTAGAMAIQLLRRALSTDPNTTSTSTDFAGQLRQHLLPLPAHERSGRGDSSTGSLANALGTRLGNEIPEGIRRVAQVLTHVSATSTAGGPTLVTEDLINGLRAELVARGYSHSSLRILEIIPYVVQRLTANGRSSPQPATSNVIDGLPRSHVSAGSPQSDMDCPICRDSFRSDSSNDSEHLADPVVITLPCTHQFHEECILVWLKSSATCPVCRHVL